MRFDITFNSFRIQMRINETFYNKDLRVKSHTIFLDFIEGCKAKHLNSFLANLKVRSVCFAVLVTYFIEFE